MTITMTPAASADARPYAAPGIDTAGTGPSFGAALCGFLCTTVATTMVMFLLSSF